MALRRTRAETGTGVPQRTRQSVGPSASGYLLLRALSTQMRTQAARRLERARSLDVIDVGCGTRPYEEIFRPYARSYLGVDIQPGPQVDLVAPAEALPLEDRSFDCAVCSQVLEHADDPRGVASEISRVLRPGGVAFISTHGVIRYHACGDGSVEDYWRWTHAGLELLLRSSGDWSEVDVYPNGGTWTALAFLVGRELEVTAAKLRLTPAVRPLVFVMNAAAWNLDRALRRLPPARPPDLAPNYLAVAVRSERSTEDNGRAGTRAVTREGQAAPSSAARRASATSS